jgi:hypothetical protein
MVRIGVMNDMAGQLPLTLAGGLRTTFADVVSSPLPDRLAVLMRRLHADRNERSGGGAPVTTRRRFRRFARDETCASIALSGLMTRFIRTLGDTSSQPLNIVTKA